MPETIDDREQTSTAEPMTMDFAEALVVAASVHLGMQVLIMSSPGEAGPLIEAAAHHGGGTAVMMGTARELHARVPEPLYDRVLMVGDIGQELVMHGLRFLKPCCGLVAVMDADIETSKNTLARTFRAMVQRRGGWFLPVQPGQPAGTVVVRIPAQGR